MLNLKYIYIYNLKLSRFPLIFPLKILQKTSQRGEVTIRNANSCRHSLSAVFHLEEVTVQQDKSMALMECTHLTTP